MCMHACMHARVQMSALCSVTLCTCSAALHALVWRSPQVNPSPGSSRCCCVPCACRRAHAATVTQLLWSATVKPGELVWGVCVLEHVRSVHTLAPAGAAVSHTHAALCGTISFNFHRFIARIWPIPSPFQRHASRRPSQIIHQHSGMRCMH